jgi:RNA polymerase sigma-70 factor (ECF subfamily)
VAEVLGIAGTASPREWQAASERAPMWPLTAAAGGSMGMVAVDETTAERDDPAVVELWSAEYPRLAGWCAALIGDSEAAHDIAGEAFLRLLTRWRTVRDPKGFLYVTALNLVRDRWRGKVRGGRLLERLRNQPAPAEVGPTGWLGDVVCALPDRLREPVVLHYYADLSVDEVGSALGRPAGTIKRQLSEARGLLAEMLREVDR